MTTSLLKFKCLPSPSRAAGGGGGSFPAFVASSFYPARSASKSMHALIIHDATLLRGEPYKMQML
jgi:hypothetical protein